MQGTIVGVLRGGPSGEHDVSIATGHAMMAHLPDDRYSVRDIYIDRKGVWHERGRVSDPARALRGLDVALVGLHGTYGEDGGVQKTLERFGIPYAGSNSFASFMAMQKVLAKERAKEAGLLTPAYRLYEHGNNVEEFARDVIRSFAQPVVVKPVQNGSSLGVSIVGGYAPVFTAVSELVGKGHEGILVEEYIRGREASAGVIEGLRGEELYALPVAEILPPEGDFYSYTSKYSGLTRHETPGNFSRTVSEDLARAARLMHRSLGLRHYSQSDFMVTPKGIYYLETDSLPTLTEHSVFPRSLASVGVSLKEFFSHLVNLALKR